MAVQLLDSDQYFSTCAYLCKLMQDYVNKKHQRKAFAGLS